MSRPGKMFPFVFKTFFKKTATVLYPTVPKVAEKDFRGKLKFDQEKCIGCKMCMRDCPANAINIEKVEEKKFKATVCLDKCIYCAQCVDSCPKDALKSTTEFELANFNRDKLKVEI
jgi:formate hydrogenlyase subunit 6/NADH:ubiquinone oxidoreductase subunit I